MTDKYYNKNGDVAVLISKDYGGGWSTWNSDYAEEMVFDKDIVKIILDNPIRPETILRLRPEDYDKVKEICKTKYPKAYVDGMDDCLTVEWLKPGTEFMIHEYDGSESIWTAEDIKKYIA